jgi:hypothetical protein
MRVDFFAEAARSTESETKELELARRSPSAVSKQLEALLAHVRIGLVGEQLDAVVERAHGRHEIMAEPRTQEAGQIDGIHCG